jgi:hypothetical protein
VEQDRRKTPRYPFNAYAEIVKESGVHVTARVTELSLHGCFLKKSNPLPEGTSFLIKIFTQTEFFEARGTVVYSQAEQGMGIMFHDIRPAFVMVLRRWLLDAMMKKQGTKT